jgi:hypothetical protein
MISKFTNKIYGITSYDTYDDRLVDLNETLSNNYELIVAPKQKYFTSDEGEFNSGAKSLVSANESIFLKEKIIKNDVFFIVEDDILLVDNYEYLLDSFFKSIPSDWDIINLGYHVNTPINTKIKETDSEYYKLLYGEELVGTHAILYKKSAVDLVLNEIDGITDPWDWFLFKKVYPKCNTYTCTKKIIFAQSYRDIEIDKNESYKKFKSKIKYDS